MVCTICRIWNIADLHEIIGGSGGDIVLAKDELLGDAAAQSHSHLVLKVAPAAQQMYALQELGHSPLMPRNTQAQRPHRLELPQQMFVI